MADKATEQQRNPSAATAPKRVSKVSNKKTHLTHFRYQNKNAHPPRVRRGNAGTYTAQRKRKSSARATSKKGCCELPSKQE